MEQEAFIRQLLSYFNLNFIKDLMDYWKNDEKIYNFLFAYTYETQCHACIEDSPGQRDHMECTNGCLREDKN